MKRFFTTVGFSFLFSLLLLNKIIPSHAFLFFLISALCCAVMLLVKKFRLKTEIIAILISFVFSSLIFILFTNNVYKPQLEYADKLYEIEATVLDYPTISSGGNYSYLIRTDKIGGNEKSIRMRLYTPYEICTDPYDSVKFSSKPFALGDNSDSILEYFKSKGTYLGVYTKDEVYISEPSHRPPVSFFSFQKAKSEKNIRKYLDGDYAEFAISLLFGDKTYLSSEMKDSFSVSGLSHIMAVSGLHFSVWIMGVYYILRKIGLNSRLSAAICIFVSWCLVFFCAFSVSVVRSAIMMTVYLSASFFRRKSDSLNSLGLSAFIICLLNPYAVSDVSFLLSFFAVLGIITFSSLFPKLFVFEKKSRIDKRLLRYALSAFGLSTAAALFTAPVLIKYFSSLSIYSPLGNIFVSFVVAPCLLLSGVLSISRNSFIAYPVRSLLLISEKYIFSVVGLINKLPFALLLSQSDAFRLFLPLALISFFFVLYCVKKNRISPSAVLCAFSFIIVTVS